MTLYGVNNYGCQDLLMPVLFTVVGVLQRQGLPSACDERRLSNRWPTIAGVQVGGRDGGNGDLPLPPSEAGASNFVIRIRAQANISEFIEIQYRIIPVPSAVDTPTYTEMFLIPIDIIL